MKGKRLIAAGVITAALLGGMAAVAPHASATCVDSGIPHPNGGGSHLIVCVKNGVSSVLWD